MDLSIICRRLQFLFAVSCVDFLLSVEELSDNIGLMKRKIDVGISLLPTLIYVYEFGSVLDIYI